jgi:hypothetical protein
MEWVVLVTGVINPGLVENLPFGNNGNFKTEGKDGPMHILLSSWAQETALQLSMYVSAI